MEKPFAREAELAEKSARLAELNAMLNMDEHSPVDTLGVDEDTDQSIREGSRTDGSDRVADRAAFATTFAERSAEIKGQAAYAKGSETDARESKSIETVQAQKEITKGKTSLIGRLQDKRKEIAVATTSGPAARMRAEPAL